MDKRKRKYFGYILVSTKEQNEERQRIAMHEFEPNYSKMMKKIKPGDTLVIKSIDRLGRNYEQILEQWRIITREKKADIVLQHHKSTP